MRKILLASAAVLGATGGAAFAQSPPNPMQGQYAAPLMGGPAANSNLNSYGTAQPGAALAPQPGTVVIRLNGKVYAGMDLAGGTGLNHPAGYLTNGATTNANGYKLNPISMDSFMRLYPGIDAMASNGLRYGAAVEIRQNFEGGNSFQVSSTTTAAGTQAITVPSGTATAGTNSSASGVSSSQTLFTRRAFVYLGSDQTGIIRLGQQDGLISIYDATGTFTVGGWDGGIGNILNSGVQSVTPNQYLITWAWLSGNGVEYADNKIVYLSPSFYGVDFGLEFGPNQGNSFSTSATSDPYAVGPCNTASANCIGVTSGTDSSRWINRGGVGVRFKENISGVVFEGYGDYTFSGHATNPAAKQAGTGAGQAGFGGGTGALKYDGQSFFNGGLAATYLGFHINGDFTHGRLNGSNGLDPTGGVMMNGELGSISYSMGQFAMGAIVGIVNSQGTAQLVNVSQRHETAFAVGGVYKLAPGINLCLEYQYLQKHQGDVNLSSGNIGPATAATIGAPGTSGNDIHVQGLTFATIVNW